MSTPVTCTVHLHPGTPRERSVRLEADVVVYGGYHRILRLDPVGGEVLSKTELVDALDAVVEYCHAYVSIPDDARTEPRHD